MRSSQTVYLETLERQAEGCEPEMLYLWPRTPIGDGIQQKIYDRVGVTDEHAHDRRARPARILGYLQRLVKAGRISSTFSVLDIACGDAIILWQIKRRFPDASCYGLDCHKGHFPSHGYIERDGVALYRAFIQHLFSSDPDSPFDIVLMLNTYRGWESAGLRSHERDLPQLADAWLERNARYAIVTATKQQIAHLHRLGLRVMSLGRGEDQSTMVCVSRLKLPVCWWGLLTFQGPFQASVHETRDS